MIVASVINSIVFNLDCCLSENAEAIWLDRRVVMCIATYARMALIAAALFKSISWLAAVVAIVCLWFTM